MDTEICRADLSEEAGRAAVCRAAEILRKGGLVAFPTETVYGLGGDGLNPASARKIYAAKGRPSDNPLILHIASRRELTPLVQTVPEAAERLMEAFWPGPMTLIFTKSDAVPPEATGGLPTVAVRMPSHPVARMLIQEAGVPVAAPSANRSGRPSPTTAAHVAEDLTGQIEMILDGGPVEIGLESTILDVTGEIPLVLRPGAISREQVEALLGDCRMDPAILGKPDPNLRPRAPGMKYRHYAPKAELTIVEGSRDAAAREISRLAAEAAARGKKVGILCAEESAGLYPAQWVKSLGTRQQEETIAHNLYRCLREFDEESVEIVYSEAFGEGPLGDAIMNRLTKAAGYRILRAEE
ncbi:MAG: threonylcarbamoyl-AMP synthase [Lachnospiraceae bacterium]|nr:threonylcarbamoyl-AMP synthase [Lachnospiraceae bacterium]